MSSSSGARGSTVVRRPCTLPARSRASSKESATTQRRPAASIDAASEPGGSGTATSASRGAVSSANGAAPRGTCASTRCPPSASSAARRAAASRSRRAPTGAAPETALADRQPARTPAEVRGERTVDVPGSCSGETHHDARRAETALRTTGRDERGRGRGARFRIEPFDRRDRTAVDARGRGHARDPRLAVDEHGATTALALGRAAVLGRHDPEPLAQHVQQRFAPLDVGIDRDLGAVEHERDRGDGHRATVSGTRVSDAKRPAEAGRPSRSREEIQENDWPQPQVR